MYNYEQQAAKIREKYKGGFANITHREQFILDRGWLFKTEKELNIACARADKLTILTLDEFITEANLGTVEPYANDYLTAVYEKLAALVKTGKLREREVYTFAKHKWCRTNPEAIIAYEVDGDRWIVNNCDEKISEAEAKIKINSLWGFEASRIQIIGTPYYSASDFQYIRFDCGRMTWLYANGTIYRVYA